LLLRLTVFAPLREKFKLIQEAGTFSVTSLATVSTFTVMNIALIAHNSAGYEKMKALRTEALLQPIGIPASYIQSEKEKDDLLIGAFEGEQLVGCCVLTPRDEGTVQLRQMVVHPEWQGKQIGKAILDFAEQTAREKGFTRLMMHARNTAIPFYQKSGYHITGNEFFEVGIGHHVMEKGL
jgi:GNAT superfamily N-acetyltransferase